MENWKKHLIGEIKLPIKDGAAIIDENEFQKPLEWPKAVCRCLCKKCGQISEIDLTYVKGLLKTMAILKTLPDIRLDTKENFKNYYFEIGYCECGPGELSVKLKEIKKELKT